MPDTIVVRRAGGGHMAIPVLDGPMAELRASINQLAADVADADLTPTPDLVARLGHLEQRVQSLETAVAALPPGLGRKP